jgi:hypothetical protein
VLKDVVKGNYGSMIVLPELPGKMEILSRKEISVRDLVTQQDTSFRQLMPIYTSSTAKCLN